MWPSISSSGARIRPEEVAAEEAAEAAEAEPRNAAVTQCKRRRRQLEILTQDVGEEHLSGVGQTRLEESGLRKPGIFTAAAYYWLYYAPAPQRDLVIVKTGERAWPGQCHAVLDAAANLDADSVTSSNTMYEFAGIDAQQSELLYTKTFTCACLVCRDPTSIRLDFRACLFSEYTGRWRQQTVHAFQGVARVAAEKRQSVREFAERIKEDRLYAVFGSHYDLGGHPYWLLWCKKAPYKAPAGLKLQDGSTINKGWWIMDAYWFASTSASRKSYKLLSDELVHVTVNSLIQETELEFDREGMHERILSEASHLNLMRHNFSNVVT